LFLFIANFRFEDLVPLPDVNLTLTICTFLSVHPPFLPPTAFGTRTAANVVVALRATNDGKQSQVPTIERGVSVDQDGKSNVWAIEPKVEVQNKSDEEKGQSALIAGGGLAAAAVAAALILSNLPDPNQF
jgi:hypothetical protein